MECDISYMLHKGARETETHSEESRSHVGLHVLIVEAHDLDQVLQCCHLHIFVGALRCFTHHLHDEVPLVLHDKEKTKIITLK